MSTVRVQSHLHASTRHVQVLCFTLNDHCNFFLEFKTLWHSITEEDAFSHPWPILKAFELQNKQMEAKLDVMIDMYSNISLQEWMSAIVHAKLSNDAATRAVSWVKMNVDSCSTESTLLDSLSSDDKIAEKLISSEKKNVLTRKVCLKFEFETPSTICDFSTHVYEEYKDKVEVSKPERNNGKLF